MVILDKFRCKAQNLTHPALESWALFLRLEGDSDEPTSWHRVDAVSYHGISGVRVLTVAFNDETPEMVLNETDEVEFAVPRPVGHVAET